MHEFFTKLKIKINKTNGLPIHRSYAGYPCSNIFFQKIRLTTARDMRPSAITYWNSARGNEIILKNAKKNNRDIFNSTVFIAHAPSQFPIVAAATIYKHFRASHVFDPYAGWGDRCIAAMACNINYTGVDCNPQLINPYNKMISTFAILSSSEIKMIFDKVENVNWNNIKCDLIFTSPPFWNTHKRLVEKYNNCESNYDTFIETSLIPILQFAIKQQITICLHIPEMMYHELKRIKKCTKIILLDSKNKMYCWY